MQAASHSAPVATALLVSANETTIEQVTDCLRQFAIRVETCVVPSTALHVLNRDHFEVVIVDFELQASAGEVLEQLRRSRSNQTAAAFAITSRSTETQTAFSAGSNFVLERPLSTESISRSLRAAYGMIMRERRRYFRCPVAIPVQLRAEGTELQCKSFNLSESGMAVSGPLALRSGSQVTVDFTIPESTMNLSTEARICWSDGAGRMGLQFQGLPSEQKLQLGEWLTCRLEEILPEDVVRMFQLTNQS